MCGRIFGVHKMVSGEKVHHHHHHHNHNHLNFHHLHLPLLHVHHHHHAAEEEETKKDIPKGCVAIMVGQGEEQQRFVIPLVYMNHPLFMQLLKEAEEEYGFHQTGPITIPCHVQEFRNVQSRIDEDNHLHHHHHHHHLGCFGV